MSGTRRRADELLTEKIPLKDIQLARALIMEGRALAAEQRITAPGQLLHENTPLRIKGLLDPYVSRGAYKLKEALDRFRLDLSGRKCIDIGSSTGGFTDVMLRSGAEAVCSVDVGYNLLDYRIRSDSRVTVLERTNARFLTRADLPFLPSFGATDVSFISLKAVLPPVLRLLEGPGASFVALVKPQFEAPKEDVGEGGIIRDPLILRNVLRDICDWTRSFTFYRPVSLAPSPITGQEGNIEFLLLLKPESEASGQVTEGEIETALEMACDKFLKLH